MDPVFKKKFGINTEIRYLKQSVIDAGKEKHFHNAWKRALKKIKSTLSKTRKKTFQAYFRRLKREGDDLYYTKRLAIKFIGKKVGYGVFAKTAIAPYSTLGDYTGLFRLEKEVAPMNDSAFKFSEFKLFSMDAQKQGNWTRFMNHGEEGNTNVVAWEYFTKERPYIVFTAGPKGIKKNGQLLYSYGGEYWDGSFEQLH